MSSLPYYVFATMGRHKTIRMNSIVAWHGNILQKPGMSDGDVRAATIKAYDQLPDRGTKKISIEVLANKSIQQTREYRIDNETRQAQFGVIHAQAPENYVKIDLTPFRQKGKGIEFTRLE